MYDHLPKETSLPLDVIRDNKNRVFIETGTFRGGGVTRALQAGFEEIHSIEIDKVRYINAESVFQGFPQIKIYNGDSIDVLPKILENINEKVTFWLDAHIEPGSPVGKKDVPLLEELEIISNHYIKDHIILIDDIKQTGRTPDRAFRHFEEGWQNVTMDKIYKLINKINSDYESFEGNNGHMLIVKVNND